MKPPFNRLRIQLLLIALGILVLAAGALFWRARNAKTRVARLTVIRVPSSFGK
jgi:hypothetical protein